MDTWGEKKFQASPLNWWVNVFNHLTGFILLGILQKSNHSILLIYCCIYLTILNLWWKMSIMVTTILCLYYRQKSTRAGYIHTIWSTCISASLELFNSTLLAISSSERVRYVWVNLWILRLYIEDTTCFTTPRLLSWERNSIQQIRHPKTWWMS